MATGPVADEDEAALELELGLEPELHPARSAMTAMPVVAATPKRLRSTISPPVFTPSDLR